MTTPASLDNSLYPNQKHEILLFRLQWLISQICIRLKIQSFVAFAVAISCLFFSSHGFGTLQKAWLFCSLTFFACLWSKSFYCIGETKLLHQESNKRTLHTVPVVSNVLFCSSYSISKMFNSVVRFYTDFCKIFLVYFNVYLFKATCHSLCFFTRQLLSRLENSSSAYHYTALKWVWHVDLFTMRLRVLSLPVCLSVCLFALKPTNHPPTLEPHMHAYAVYLHCWCELRQLKQSFKWSNHRRLTQSNENYTSWNLFCEIRAG